MAMASRALSFSGKPWPAASWLNSETYASINGLFNSRGSAPSTAYCRLKSHLPRPTAVPNCLRNSISLARNAEGMRTLRSSCLPLSDRNSAVYRRDPMRAEALP